MMLERSKLLIPSFIYNNAYRISLFYHSTQCKILLMSYSLERRIKFKNVSCPRNRKKNNETFAVAKKQYLFYFQKTLSMDKITLSQKKCQPQF